MNTIITKQKNKYDNKNNYNNMKQKYPDNSINTIIENLSCSL